MKSICIVLLFAVICTGCGPCIHHASTPSTSIKTSKEDNLFLQEVSVLEYTYFPLIVTQAWIEKGYKWEHTTFTGWNKEPEDWYRLCLIVHKNPAINLTIDNYNKTFILQNINTQQYLGTPQKIDTNIYLFHTSLNKLPYSDTITIVMNIHDEYPTKKVIGKVTLKL